MSGWMRQPGMIGLDIGRRTVKAAQLTRRGDRWSVVALASFARRQADAPVSDNEAAYIAEVLRRRGFCGKRVALAAPQDALVTALLDLPPVNPTIPRERVVRMEIARAQRVAPEGLTCCWSELPATDNASANTQALCWGLQHEKAAALIDGLERAGLEASRIEPTALALQRGCAQMLPAADRISAIADLGAGGVRLILMFQGRVVHERLLPECGASAMVAALAEKLEAPAALAERAMHRFGVEKESASTALAVETASTIGTLLDSMVEQVSLSFSFVSHQYPRAELGPLLLTGGIAGIPGLAAAMAGGMELQVVPITPGVVVDAADPTSDTLDASLLTAIGLAMARGGNHG